jgi:hypothetical protein
MQEQELGAFCWKRVGFQDLVYYRQKRNYVHLLFIQIYIYRMHVKCYFSTL